jgi:hypothetical protein
MRTKQHEKDNRNNEYNNQLKIYEHCNVEQLQMNQRTDNNIR